MKSIEKSLNVKLRDLFTLFTFSFFVHRAEKHVNSIGLMKLHLPTALRCTNVERWHYCFAVKLVNY